MTRVLITVVCAALVAISAHAQISAPITHSLALQAPFTETSNGNNCNGPCLVDVSYTTAQGWDGDKTQQAVPTDCTGTPGAPGSGSTDFDDEHTGLGTVSGLGGWDTANHSCDQVIEAANYPGGAGGRGFRHFRGDGRNNNGGGIKFSWAAGITDNDISMCHRFRYASNFRWRFGAPVYVKEFNMTQLSPQKAFAVVGVSNNRWALNISNRVNFTANRGRALATWTGVMGGPQGDGKWHEFAWHGNISRTTLRIWIDDVLVFERTDMPWAMYGYAAFPNGYYPSNQGVVDNDDDGIGDGDEASSPDLFTDYDDHTVDTAVSNNGKLEC